MSNMVRDNTVSTNPAEASAGGDAEGQLPPVTCACSFPQPYYYFGEISKQPSLMQGSLYIVCEYETAHAIHTTNVADSQRCAIHSY